MKFSKTTLKHLTHMYRSVLKKCFLINTVVMFGALTTVNSAELNFDNNFNNDINNLHKSLIKDYTISNNSLSLNSSYQATVNGVNYCLLLDAVKSDAARAGSVVTLNEDVQDGYGIKVDGSGANVSINFNNKTYTGYRQSTGSAGTTTQLFQLLKNNNVTFSNGRLNIASVLAEDGRFVDGIRNYSNLTLNNMIVDGSNLIKGTRDGETIWGDPFISVYGTVNINNSTFIANKGGNAFTVSYGPDVGGTGVYHDGTQVTLNNSDILGNLNMIYDEKTPTQKTDALTYSILNLHGNNTITGNFKVTAGTVNFKSGILKIFGSIYNDGAFHFEPGSILNVNLTNGSSLITGNATDQTGTIDGTVELVLNNITDNFTFKVENQSDVSDFTINGNSLYNISTTDNISYNVIIKPTGEIINNLINNGADQKSAEIISGLVNVGSNNEIVKTILELAQTGDGSSAAQVVKDLSPDTSNSSSSISNNTNSAINSAVGNHVSSNNVSSGDSFGGSIWAKGLYNYSKQDQKNSNLGFKSDTTGLIIGIDNNITENVLLGLGYAYTKTDLKSGTRKTDIDGYTFLTYAEYKPSNWYIDTLLSFTLNKYDEEKYPAGVKLTSNYLSNTYVANLMIGYNSTSNLSPEIGVRYLYIDQDSYNDGIQKINTDTNDILTGVIGLKYSNNVKINKCVQIKPIWKLALTYDFISDPSETDVTIVGTNSYTYHLKGERLKKLAVETGLGLTTSINDWDLTIEYDSSFRKGLNSHTGMLNVKYYF